MHFNVVKSCFLVTCFSLNSFHLFRKKTDITLTERMVRDKADAFFESTAENIIKRVKEFLKPLEFTLTHPGC